MSKCFYMRIRIRSWLKLKGNTDVSLLDLTADLDDFNLIAGGKRYGLSFMQRPLWANEWGRDRFGLYADLKLEAAKGNVIQRFRWIEPGEFLMGSPENEAERWSNREQQHSVTLTQGYWLADTAVTQALWLAVMGGKNPSRFTDDLQNPVEQVSWDEAQKFIGKLNKLITGPNAQLPTEAQWEYACRAGTQTPFYFGANISPEQVNHNGDSSYAGNEKGLYREKTVPVKSLPVNPWGLFEMHGNVWEWCQDAWQENLGNEQVTDPLTNGAEEGIARVLRGGSWVSDGWQVRSANRISGASDGFNHFIGFRLSLGHAEIKSGRDSGAYE